MPAASIRHATGRRMSRPESLGGLGRQQRDGPSGAHHSYMTMLRASQSCCQAWAAARHFTSFEIHCRLSLMYRRRPRRRIFSGHQRCRPHAGFCIQHMKSERRARRSVLLRRRMRLCRWQTGRAWHTAHGFRVVDSARLTTPDATMRQIMLSATWMLVLLALISFSPALHEAMTPDRLLFFT